MATSHFPFPYHAASPPFPATATYPPPPTRNSPIPTQIHGYHHPSPFFYPSPTQIHGGLYPPPLYPGGYCSAPPTHSYPAPFLSNHYSQFHSPPPDWPSPPTPALAPTGDPANSVMPATTLPIRPESWSPNLRTTASASRMQPDHSPVALHDHAQSLLLQDSEVNAFQHHTTLPSISASKMANAGVPDGLIAMEPSQASRTAEDFPVLCTDECTDQKDAEKSSSVLHHATPAALPDHTPSWLLDTVRTPPNRERTPLQSSFDSLHGELSKLPAAVSQFAAVMGLQTTETLVTSSHLFEPTASAPLFGNTNASSPITTATTTRTNSASPSPVCSMNPSTGTADLVPQVLGEIPTPSSWKGTHDYPLERAVPEPVFDVSDVKIEHCSNVFVDVSASPPEQQSCEEEQQEGAQLPKCNSKPIFSPERAAVCSGSVFSLKIEEIICDSEKMNDSDNQFLAKQHIDQLLHCSSTAPQCSTYEEECQGDENILWVKSVCQTSTGNSISFYQWDPGASTPLHSSKFGTYVQQPRDPSWNAVIVPERRAEWDPGDTKLHDLFSVAAVAKKIPSTHAYKCVRVQILVGQFGASREPSFTCATMHPYAFGLGCKRVNALVLIVLAVQGSTGRSVAKPLLFLANDGNSSTKHSSPKLFMHIYLDTRAMQTFPWLQNPLLTDLQCQLPMLNSSELLQHMVIVLYCWCPSFEMAKLQCDPGIATPSSIYLCLQVLTERIATEKSLSWLPIPELAKRQSQVTSASFICDPGTLLWYKFIWWLFTVRTNFEQNPYSTPKFNGSKAAYSSQIFQKCKAMNSQLYCHEDIKFIGIALWLIHFHPP